MNRAVLAARRREYMLQERARGGGGPVARLPVVEFMKSAAQLTDCPEDSGLEVMFVGRSNAGKSSALNVIAGSSELARVSKTPGRTALLNFYSVGGPSTRFVDSPGYGFAAVPHSVRLQWQSRNSAFVASRSSLSGVVHVMDVRTPLLAVDLEIIQKVSGRGCPLCVLLSKVDKIGVKAAQSTKAFVESSLAASTLALNLNEGVQPSSKDIKPPSLPPTVILFSATRQDGLADIRSWLRGRLALQ